MLSSLSALFIAIGLSASNGARVQHRSSASSLLEPLSVGRPDTFLHPPKERQELAPVNTEVEGVKHTNKFWGNWDVADAPVQVVTGEMSIYPAPYSLRFKKVGESDSGALSVGHANPEYHEDSNTKRFRLVTNQWRPDFHVGSVEPIQGRHSITKEQQFGVHVEIRGQVGKITFPVYSGMAYFSAQYEHLTPRIGSDEGLESVQKVDNGVWSFTNSAGSKHRVYVLSADGKLVDGSYDFDSAGDLNKKLTGWVRLAYIQKDDDASGFDMHAEAVPVGCELSVSEGLVSYDFSISGTGTLLHYAYDNHLAFLSLGGASETTKVQKLTSNVKGKMTPVVGNQWRMEVDLSQALALDMLPATDPPPSYVEDLKVELMRDWEKIKYDWRFSLFRRDHYFSGKGFQKVGNICLLLKKYFGESNKDWQECAKILESGFECMYKREVVDGSDRVTGEDDDVRHLHNTSCLWAPVGTWYDETWGGIPSRWDDPNCFGKYDFGSACFNDHHYHWAYFVVSAAMLLELNPNMRNDLEFVDFINMFIRDTSNPSPLDTYFPQFRSFDWFDMHSWSRGLLRSDVGKDQESTSEEINLHYGLILWGRAIGKRKLELLGATMLTLASQSLQNYFLMRRDNPVYPPKFSLNHVTGIFFQNKVEVTTWFGNNIEYINGIQMIPLTPALPLSRTVDFCREEWEDILMDLEMSPTNPWTSLLLTGNLAFHNPNAAWKKLKQIKPEHYDDGLTKTWALYWTSVQEGMLESAASRIHRFPVVVAVVVAVSSVIQAQL